jgi:hypothetical protein
MTTNFTLRDFFVYLLTGMTLIICIGTIFYIEIFNWIINFFSRYEFIKDFSFLVTIFLVPIIYLLGQIIGSLSYNLLQFYLWLDKRTFFKREMPEWKYFILTKFQQILYRQRVVYAIISNIKSKRNEKLYKTVGEFWTVCAKLQIEKIYSPAEYWYVLNELFKSINLIFFISLILSIFTEQWVLSIIYFILTISAFKRAKQYAGYFIQTVLQLDNCKTD